MENIRKLIKSKMIALSKADESFHGLYEIIHQQDNCIFCEEYNGYKVTSTSYDEYKALCERLGQSIRATLKDEAKDSFVGLLMENNHDWIACFWGILMAGYKPMLLNVRLPNQLNQKIIERLNIHYVITNQRTPLQAHIIQLDELKKQEVSDERPFVWANEMALSTSATSLNVKICIYNGSDVLNEVKNAKGVLKRNKMVKRHYEHRLKLLAFLPFYHIFGLFATYFWFSTFGRTFVFLHDYSSDTILRTVRRLKVTHVFAVPMLWNGIYQGIIREVNNEDEKTKKKFYQGITFSLKLQKVFPRLGSRFAKKAFRRVRDNVFGDSIKFMISGGSYIPLDTLRLINGIGYPLVNGYGMSEIGITSFETRANIKHRIKGSIGQPLDNVEYLIDNEVLMVKSKSMCSKIITMDQEMLISHDEYFKTCDLAYQDAKGYYYLKGRLDDVVTLVSGEKINPDLVEKEIFLPDALHYSVLGLKDEAGNHLSLIVEVASGTNKLRLEKLLNDVDYNVNKLANLHYLIESVYFTFDPLAPPTAIKVG
ncbi:MAG: AMP-binding protein, partial [Bacilli bacterium]|nr:AMP-binding protein [Bacilli bacterium]